MRNLLSVIAILFGLCGFLAFFSPEAADAEPITFGDRLTILPVAGVPFLFGCLFLFAPVYNRLKDARNQCDMAFSNIDILLERRHDVLDNLIAVSERYASHENSILVDVAAHRSRSGSATLESRMNDAREQYSPRLLSVAEAYPDLKADQAFNRYSHQLNETENGIADERKAYNQAVLTFNNRISAMPDLIIARLFQFRERAFFQGSAKKLEAPKVSRLA